MSAARQVLLDLADRCEREEPSRELDAEIAAACRLVNDFDESVYIVPLTWRALGARVEIGSIHQNGQWWTEASRAPALFSTSLDAAVTLVPADTDWALQVEPGDAIQASVWVPGDDDGIHSFGSTPALALCAASLRARAEAL